MGQSDLKIFNFQERLEFSKKPENELFWQTVYRKAFPDMLFAKACVGDGQGQRLGIDRIVQLSSGKTLHIEEKTIEKDHQSFFLEYISNSAIKSEGWIKKELLIDYFAYAFIPSGRCYLFPWQLLKRTWNYHKNNWMNKYPKASAQNNGYSTQGLIIPISDLVNAIRDSIIIQVSVKEVSNDKG